MGGDPGVTSTLEAPPPSTPATGPAEPEDLRRQGRSARAGDPVLSGGWTVGGLGVLGVLALYGFQAAYGGSAYLLAGGVGLVLGLGVAWWSARSRQPVIVVAAVTLVVFFLFGGAVATPEQAVGGVLPAPGTVFDLVDGAIQGWARLLTTTPPVGDAANLLAVPYLCGLLCGVVALSVASRSRVPHAAVVAPVAVLALSILFGTREPASLLLQGALFGAVAVAWISHVQRQRRRVDVGNRRRRRWVGGAAILVLAAVAALLFGDAIPGAGTRPRLVLRDYTEPPFDPADHPSPLASYRRFTNGEPLGAEAEQGPEEPPVRDGWRSTPLFSVRGLPADQRIRLATLDTYDGVVYRVGAGQGSSGFFQRVGERIPNEASGSEVEVRIDVLGDGGAGYRDIWLPTVDGLTGLRFVGEPDRAAELADSLRLNVDTRTAAVPVRLRPGDRYEMTMVPTSLPAEEELIGAAASDTERQELARVEAVLAAAREFADRQMCDKAGEQVVTDGADAGSFYRQVQAIAGNLRSCGGLSDGRSSKVRSEPGHHAARLGAMVGEDQLALVGNGEQFAPLAALMSDAIGVPSRVVMGFRSRAESNEWRTADERGLAPHRDTYEVMGADVTAWIEVALEGVGWVPIPDVTPVDAEPESRPRPQPREPENDPPPPPPSIPPGEEELAETDRMSEREPVDDDEGFTIPGWLIKVGLAVATPLAVLASITGLIAGLKARRRTRRRSTGDAASRVDGGWQEIVDLATDLGSPIPDRVTRREGATFMARPDVLGLARHADRVTFGPDASTDVEVDRYWDEVDAVRTGMVAELSRFDRWKALVSLSSLRGSARRGRADRRPRRSPHLRLGTRSASTP